MGLNSADKRKQTALWFYRTVPGKTFSSVTIDKYLAWESFSVTRVYYPRALTACIDDCGEHSHGTVRSLVAEQLCLQKINLR